MERVRREGGRWEAFVESWGEVCDSAHSGGQRDRKKRTDQRLNLEAERMVFVVALDWVESKTEETRMTLRF